MPSSFQIRTLRPADVSETVELLADAFCERDPIEAALGITPSDFRSMAQHEVAHLLADGLSLVAVSTTTGEIVGTMVASDACTSSPPADYAAQHKFRPVAALMHSLTNPYLTRRAFSRGESIYLYMLAVGCHSEGHGVGRNLVTEALKQAKTRGYRTAFAAVTNRTSHRVLARQGFDDLAGTDYRDFQFEGQPVFADIPTHHRVTLIEKTL